MTTRAWMTFLVLLLIASANARADAISASASAASVMRPVPLQTRAAALEVHFVEAARVYMLPVAFLLAVARVESSFNSRALSPVGALGIMQLMPDTAREMHVRDRLDPRDNIFGGARYLRILTNRWRGDAVRTIASYRDGPERVARYKGVTPPNTQRYVKRVLHYYNAYRRTAPASPTSTFR